MVIRHAIYADVPQLVGLVTSFFCNNELEGTGLAPDTDTITFFVQDCIESGNYAVLVAEDNGRIIGSIAGGVTPWMFNADILTLMELGWFVPKEVRAQYPRAGLALRNAFHQWGKERGATVLIMVSTTREESPRVRRWYEKQGLRHIDSNYIGRL